MLTPGKGNSEDCKVPCAVAQHHYADIRLPLSAPWGFFLFFNTFY